MPDSSCSAVTSAVLKLYALNSKLSNLLYVTTSIRYSNLKYSQNYSNLLPILPIIAYITWKYYIVAIKLFKWNLPVNMDKSKTSLTTAPIQQNRYIL